MPLGVQPEAKFNGRHFFSSPDPLTLQINSRPKAPARSAQDVLTQNPGLAGVGLNSQSKNLFYGHWFNASSSEDESKDSVVAGQLVLEGLNSKAYALLSSARDGVGFTVQLKANSDGFTDVQGRLKNGTQDVYLRLQGPDALFEGMIREKGDKAEGGLFVALSPAKSKVAAEGSLEHLGGKVIWNSTLKDHPVDFTVTFKDKPWTLDLEPLHSRVSAHFKQEKLTLGCTVEPTRLSGEVGGKFVTLLCSTARVSTDRGPQTENKVELKVKDVAIGPRHFDFNIGHSTASGPSLGSGVQGPNGSASLKLAVAPDKGGKLQPTLGLEANVKFGRVPGQRPKQPTK